MNTLEIVTKKIAETLACIEPGDVQPQAKLSEDLGADSLDHVELAMAIEQEFDIWIDDAAAETLKTVQDFVDIVEKLKK